MGASLGVMKDFYQGLFLAPTVVKGAVKGAIFAAGIYEKLGFSVIPSMKEERHDIIQAVEFGTAEGVIRFCQGIQAAAPVDSYVTPEPWAMRGMTVMLLWRRVLLFRVHLSSYRRMLRSNRHMQFIFRGGLHGSTPNSEF